MSLIAQCAACKKQYRFGDEMAGRKVKCKHCGQIISVPGAQASAAPKPPAAAARSSSYSNPLDDPGFSAGGGDDDSGSMEVAPPPPVVKPKAAPRRATRSDGDDVLAAPDTAPQTRVRKPTVKRPPPTSGGAGPDGVTPLLCLLYAM